MTKFFKKSKKPYFGAILGPFFQDLGKNEFSWKKGLCQFLNIPIIYHHAENQKKIISHSRRNNYLMSLRVAWCYIFSKKIILLR